MSGGSKKWITATNLALITPVNNSYWMPIIQATVTSHGPNQMPVTSTTPVTGLEAGAAPSAEPKMHIKPHEAAIRIREIVKEMWQKQTAPSFPAGDFATQLSLARSHQKSVRTFVSYIPPYLTSIEERLKRIEARTRSAAQLEEIGVIREYLSYISSEVGRAQEHDSALKSRLDRMHQVLGGEGQGQGIAASPQQLDELHKLAQALPTFEGAHMTPAENILHAIGVLMKNNGFLNGSE